MASVAPAAKKQKRECLFFYNKWIKEFKGIGKSSKGINKTTKKLIYKVECRNRVIKRHTLVGVAC